MNTSNMLDKDHCCYCGRKFGLAIKTVDHLVPLSLGGADSQINRVPSCKKCNRMKSNQSLYDFKEKAKKINDNRFINKRLLIENIEEMLSYFIYHGNNLLSHGHKHKINKIYSFMTKGTKM